MNGPPGTRRHSSSTRYASSSPPVSTGAPSSPTASCSSTSATLSELPAPASLRKPAANLRLKTYASLTRRSSRSYRIRMQVDVKGINECWVVGINVCWVVDLTCCVGAPYLVIVRGSLAHLRVLHSMCSGLEDRPVRSSVLQPCYEDGPKRLWRDGNPRMALEATRDPLRPRARLHGAVVATLWGVEEICATLAHIIKLQHRTVLVENRGEFGGKACCEWAVEPVYMVKIM